MVRSALTNKAGAQMTAGPVAGASFIPVATVLAGSALATSPIVPVPGRVPTAGFLSLLALRLLRADAWQRWLDLDPLTLVRSNAKAFAPAQRI